MFIRLQRPVLRPRCGDSPRRSERRWPQWHNGRPWDSTLYFTVYACRLHKILVNKDLCFTLNAHKISNSKYFFNLFLDFFFILSFLLLSLFVGQDLLRILRCSNKLPRVSFLSGTTKAKLKYCKLHKSHYSPLFLSPP